MRLEQIARATGGTAHFPFSADQLDGVYDRIADELSSRYTLGYLSTDERSDGAWRDVKIRVKRPDLKDVKIRTRPGYFAPFREGSEPPAVRTFLERSTRSNLLEPPFRVVR